jgi:GTP-binding protein
MIERYLRSRNNLVQVALLVDIRHKPTAQDCQMYEWMKHYGYEGLVVATKGDKVSKNQQAKHLKIIRDTLSMDKDAVIIPTSTLKKTGIDELKDEIEKTIG